MVRQKQVLTLHLLTPLHVGSGTSSSYVDLPVAREKHTDFPIIPASGIKGVFRDLAERKNLGDKIVEIIFGPEPGKGGENFASCISFTDAKILLFPVRSVRGVFAWITSPYVLRRFQDELRSLGCSVDINAPSVDDSKVVICGNNNSQLTIDNNKVALEEFVFEVVNEQNADDIVNWLEKFLPSLKDNLKQRLAIVSDNIFRDFVKYAVEIRTRIRIDQTTGTVATGALFTIELVPAEAVFYSFLFFHNPFLGVSGNLLRKMKEEKKNGVKDFKDLLEKDKEMKEEIERKDEAVKEKIELAYNGDILTDEDIKKKFEDFAGDNKIIQLGGDETLGMGLIRVDVYDCPESNKNQTQGQAEGKTQSGGSNK